MITLAALLGRLITTLQGHPLCKKIIAIETREFSSNQFFLKIRAQIIEKTRLQVRIYYKHGHIDYAYQVLTDVPLLRWDNKEEFQYLATFPHHFHDMNGSVQQSPLTGNPVTDIKIVLEEILKMDIL